MVYNLHKCILFLVPNRPHWSIGLQLVFVFAVSVACVVLQGGDANPMPNPPRSPGLGYPEGFHAALCSTSGE